MNRKDTFLDFIIYALLNSDQLDESNVLFFKQDFWSTNYKDNYIDFIEPFKPFTKAVKFEGAEDDAFTLSPKERSMLLTAFKVFYQKSDSVFTLNDDDIQLLCNSYMELKSNNPNVFVSYYVQLIDFLSAEVSEIFEEEKLKILNIKEKQASLSIQLSKEYIESKRNEYKERLFTSLEESVLQFQGFFDNKGVYIDKLKTLIRYISSIKQNETNYFIIKPDIYASLDYLIYQYLNYEIFNDRTFVNLPLDDGLKPIADEFQEYQSQNIRLITFLEDKGFELIEINSILNALMGGKYTQLNIRTTQITKQLDLFRFFYLFYIFDFFNSEGISFLKEKDFSEVLSLQNLFEDGKNIQNQYHKYYKYISSPEVQNYPFQKMDGIYDKVTSDLGISKGKLKFIS